MHFHILCYSLFYASIFSKSFTIALKYIQLFVIALCVLHAFCSITILYESVDTFVFNCWCFVAFIFGLK